METMIFVAAVFAYIMVGTFFATLFGDDGDEEGWLVIFWPFAIAFAVLVAVLCVPTVLANWIKEKW